MSNWRDDARTILKDHGYTPKKSVSASNIGKSDISKNFKDVTNTPPTVSDKKSKNKGTAAAKLPEIGSNSFENIPTYKEQKKAFKDNTAAEFKDKYGVYMSAFKQSDYYKWATEHGFVFMHADQAGLSESPRMGTKHSEEDIAEEKRLRYLLQYNNRREELEQDKNGAVKAAASGARNSIAFNTFKRLENWADKNDSMRKHGKYVNALSEEYKANLADIDTQYEQNHPTAKAVGEGAADLAKLTALQGVIGKAVDGIGWLASKPQWVIRAVKDGLTFGIKNGLDSAGRGDDAKTVARNTGIGTVGGAAGGTAAHFTGAALENVLFRYGLQNKVIPEIIRNGTAAANFSLADTASTYFLHPENERPSAQEIAKNAGVAFAFASITTAVHTSEIKANSKQTLDNLDKNMTASYEEMLRAAVEKDGVNTKKFAQNVINYTEAMERYLDGKGVEILDDNAASSTVGEYLVEQGKIEPKTNETVLEKARFVGEDSRVRSIKSDLQEIRSRAQDYLTKADAIVVDGKATDTPLEMEGGSTTNTESIRTEQVTTPKAEPLQTISREISPEAQKITTELGNEYNVSLVGRGNKIDKAYKAIHDNPHSDKNAMTAWEISSEIGRGIAQGIKADNVEETGNNIAAHIFEKLFEDMSVDDNADTNSASKITDNETATETQTVDRNNGGFIDDREYSGVGKRNINAFQYDNPEVKPFYKAAANELLSDISSTVKGQKVYISSSNMANGTPDRVTGQKHLTSESVAKIKDVTGASYDQIKDALTRLINDHGQENIALAKRIELVIDDMLTDGYTDFNGNNIPPNEEYIAVKNNLSAQSAPSTQTAETQSDMTDYRAGLVTENIAKGMNAKTGAPSRADNMQNANSRIQSDSSALFDHDFVRAYTKDFLIGMAQKNSSAFNALKQMDGYVGEELIKEVIHGNAAPEYKNNNYFRIAAEELKKVLADAAEKNVIMRNRTYGENEQLNKQLEAIRTGDFSVVAVNGKENEATTASREINKTDTDILYNKGGDRVSEWGNNGSITYLTDNDVAEYAKTGNQHTRHKKARLIDSGESPILKSKAETDAFIDKALTNPEWHETKAFARADERMVSDVANVGSLDINGYYLELNSSDIGHTAEHKSDNRNNQIPLSDEDIKNLPDYIVNYDDVLEVNRKKDGRKTVVLGKQINGHSIVVTVASEGRHSLTLKSAYMLDTQKYGELYGTKKEDTSNREAIAPNNSTMPDTSDNVPLSVSPSNDIISQGERNVNNSEVVNSDIQQSKTRASDDWQGATSSGEKKGSIKLHDITKYVSDTFNVPISVGNMHSNRAAGQYQQKAKAIRIKIANDLPTITHELGHLLDEKYNMSNMEHINDALDFAEQNNPTLMALYKAEDKPGEAKAEFVKELLKDPEKVKKAIPNFYNEFMDMIDEQDEAALDKVSEMVQDYFNSDFREKVEAATITNKEIRKAERGDVRSHAEAVYTRLIDDFAPIKNAVTYVEQVESTKKKGVNNAYTMAINSRNADAVTSFILGKGMTDSNGKIVEGKSFMDCIKGIEPKSLKDFDTYLILKHSLEWLEPKDGEVKRVFADDLLQDTNRIKQEIATYESEHPEYVEAANDLYQYQRQMLKLWVVDAGGMSEELYNSLQEKYPFYVPLMRYKNSNGKKGTRTPFANQTMPISRAKGSGATIISPLESIMRNTEKFVKFSTRNKVMGVLAGYTNDIEGFAQFMEEVPPDRVMREIGVLPQVERVKKAMSGLDEADFTELSDALDNIFGDSVVSYTPVAKAGKQIVTYMQDGKYRYFQIHDKPLYDAVANMSPNQLKGLGTLGKALNATNVLITQYNYLFGVKNPIRDFDTALKHTQVFNNPLSFAKAYMSAFKDVLTNGEAYKAYQAAGGGHMSMFSDNIDSIQKALHDVAKKDKGRAARLAYSIFLHPIETITSLNEVTETIPRLAEFKGMLNKGADTQEAIEAASDVTVNFSRSGETGRTINKIFRFSNAALQGLDKERRTLTTGGGKQITKYILRYLASAVFSTALLEFWNRIVDEDGWEELSNYQKNNFYCFAYGGGHFVKIPKAREAAILNSLTERSIDFAFGDKDAFYQFGEYIGDTILPDWIPLTSFITGIQEGGLDRGIEDALHQAAGGTLLGGIVDNMYNKDFKGTPIVSMSLEDTPPKEQEDQRTTWLAHGLGQLLNISPLKADHIIDSYTGIIAKLNRAYGVKDSEQVDLSGGFKNTFTADSVYSTDEFNKVYEGRDTWQKEFNNNPSPGNACRYEKFAMAASYITKCNSKIKTLDKDKQREAKKQLLEDVKKMQPSLSSTDKEIVRSLKGNGSLDYSVKSMPKDEITHTYKGTTYSYKMSYSEYRQYMKDYMSEVARLRSELMYHPEYTNATADEKIELLKGINSDAGKNVKEEYWIKFGDRFKAE